MQSFKRFEVAKDYRAQRQAAPIVRLCKWSLTNMCPGPPVAPGVPGLITTAVFLLCVPAVLKNNTTPRLGLCAGIYCIYFPKREEAKVGKGGKKNKRPRCFQNVGNMKADNESILRSWKSGSDLCWRDVKRFFRGDNVTRWLREEWVVAGVGNRCVSLLRHKQQTFHASLALGFVLHDASCSFWRAFLKKE